MRQIVDGHARPALGTLRPGSRSADDKRGLLRQLFDGKVQPATLLLVGQAVSGAHGSHRPRAGGVPAPRGRGQEREARHRAHRSRARDCERDRLAKALSKQYGTAVHLQVVVDPDVVGGLRVEIGDDVIDGTVSSRLEDAQRKLAG